MEGIRLNGTFGSYRRADATQTFNDEPEPVHVKPGDKVFCSFIGAAKDASVFPDPEKVKIDRPLDSYVHYGIGEHTCLGKDASMVALTAMLRTVGRLDGLRRAPGGQWQLKKVPRPGGFYGESCCVLSASCMLMRAVYMTEDHGRYFVFPLTLKVHYDRIV
jgi:linoleate 10R-lipoxygenase